jgi:hypothetical protein
LTLIVVENVEQVEELFLGSLLASEQVHVIEQQGGGSPIALAPGLDPIPVDRIEQLVDKLLRRKTGDPCIWSTGELIANRVQEVRLAYA